MQQLTWSKLILITLFSFAALANNIICRKSSVTLMIEMKKVKKEQEACFLKTKDKQYYISKVCKKNCLALKHHKIFVDPKVLQSEIGSPGFKLCTAYKGIPEIIIINEGTKKERMTDKCTFKDKSFISTTYLMDEYAKVMY